ncbi:TetR family transcriptional regulator [Calidifontibacter terrae]
MILEQARILFGEKGFDRTTMREVAAAAGVDVALISHYFGNKRGLFVATIDFPADPDAVMGFVADCPRDELGERVVAAVVGVWDSDLGPALAARFRAAMLDTEFGTMRELLLGVIAEPLRKKLAGTPDLELRISLFAAQMGGLLILRNLVGLPELKERDTQSLARLVGPSIQRYLTGDLP